MRRGIEVTATRHIELPGLEPRGAVFAKVGGLSIVGTHLGLMRRWRHMQMHAILIQIGEEARSTIIVGDFNEWSDIRGCEPWADTFNILYPGADVSGPGRPVAGRSTGSLTARTSRYCEHVRADVRPRARRIRSPSDLGEDQAGGPMTP